MRRVRIGRAMAWPPLVGALWVVAVSVWAGLRTTVDADVGDERRAAAVETFIAHRFPAELWRMKVGVIAAAVALGLVLGLAAELLLRWRRARRRSFARSLLVVVLLHALLLAWAMADTPQLYAASFYAQGGVLRAVQLICTDVLGPHGVLALGAVLALVFVRRRLPPIVRHFRRFKMAAPAALGFLGVGHEAAPPPVDDRPNILVLAADSFRADRLGPRVTPNLARLAAESTRFDRAYVSLPRTFPSWVTLLTGRHAHHHGIRSMFPTWDERARDFDALPERLAHAGYRTAVVSDYAGDIFGRIQLGFQQVNAPSFDFRQVIRQKALERELPLLPVLHSHLGRALFPVMRELAVAADPWLLADDVERTLDGLGGKPFFLTVFFSTAHFPYAAPAPYYRKFTSAAYRGRFKYHKPLGLGRADEVPPDAADIAQIRGLYDGALNGIDDAAGRVLAALKARGLDRRTIVVVTGDHGETLFENDHGQGHGDTLFGDEATHVPLVIHDPRIATHGVSTRIVRDVDLAPTLLELVGLEPGARDGRSLVPALRNEPLAPRFAYGETELWFTEDIPGLAPELRMPYPGLLALNELDAQHGAEIVLRREMVLPTLLARHRMIRDERWKLVYVPTRAGVRWFLFDTERDPGETTDVAAGHPAEVGRLSAELWRWMLEDPGMERRDGFLVPRHVVVRR